MLSDLFSNNLESEKNRQEYFPDFIKMMEEALPFAPAGAGSAGAKGMEFVEKKDDGAGSKT